MAKRFYIQAIITLWLCAMAPSLSAQTSDIEYGKYNKKKYIKAADDELKKGSIFSATDLYLQVVKNNPEDISVLPNLALTYQMARDYEKAEEWYTKAYEADSADNMTCLYNAALMMKMQGKYKEAIPKLQRFSKLYKNPDDASKYKKWAKTEIDGCNFALKEGTPDAFIKVTHLGKEVNSNYKDIAPVLFKDTLFFSSIRSDTVLWMKDRANDTAKEGRLIKMFYSTVNGESYGMAERFKEFAEKDKHVANGSFSTDYKKFFYTICAPDLYTLKCDIYMSENIDGEWKPGKKLDENVNAEGYSSVHPSYAKLPSGQEVLFFTSDRPEGRGGKDIWYSFISKKGEFGKAKNAGNKINTDRTDETPFYDTRSGTLYFSSNGWINMGGTDIYKAQGEPNKFATVENLGAPFNSPCDDTYFRFSGEDRNGYFVSNRPGIFSVRGKTCCDDIFQFKYLKEVYIAVKGHVYLDGDDTKTPLTGVAVNLSLRSGNLTESDVIINTDTTKGTPPYFFNLKAEKLYKVTAMKEGYFTSSQQFTTLGIVKSDTLEVDLYLKKLEKNKAYRLNNIYYDFDKADLRPESKVTLDTLYNILMENPTIIIELSSHTDIRGSDQYNLNLSQKRAESCVNYLINEKGIPKERITAKGYGETKTLEDCTKIADCPMDQSGDCPCHQLNRRTEFKVVGELDGKLIYENE